MKSIKPTPTQELLKELFDYNPETGVITWAQDIGHSIKRGDVAGHTMKCGYRRLVFGGNKFVAHRIIWKWMTGEDPAEGMVIDHINDLPHDNRWENLRLLTNAENCKRTPKGTNKGVRRPNSTWKPKKTASGHKGIYWKDPYWIVVWHEEVALTAGDTSVTSLKTRCKSFRNLDQAVAFQAGLKGSED